MGKTGAFARTANDRHGAEREAVPVNADDNLVLSARGTQLAARNAGGGAADPMFRFVFPRIKSAVGY